jgi:hypothetical protein
MAAPRSIPSSWLVLAGLSLIILVGWSAAGDQLLPHRSSSPSMQQESAQAQQHAQAYSATLAQIKADDPQAVIKALNEFKTRYEALGFSVREQGFLKFLAWYTQLVDTLNEQPDVRNLSTAPPEDQARLPYVAVNYAKRGLDLRGSEGEYFLAVHYGFLNDKFGRLLDTTWQTYLTWRAQEQREGFWEDAGITVSWETMRERLQWLNQFVKAHPQFSQRSRIIHHLHGYFYAYLMGGDNTPVTQDWNSNRLRPEVLKSYQLYVANETPAMAQFPEFQQLVRDYLARLAKTHNRVTPELAEWRKQALAPYAEGGVDVIGYSLTTPPDTH